jgi:hypothetical protein
VCDEGKGHKERLGEERLVVWTCEEEIAVCLADRTGEEWDDSDVCDMECCENCEGVRGVSLGSCYCLTLVFDFFLQFASTRGGDRLTPPHNPMIPQSKPERPCPLDSACTWSPTLPLRLVREVALFLVFDWCFFDRRGIDFHEAHYAGLLILYRRDISILERRHRGQFTRSCGVVGKTDWRGGDSLWSRRWPVLSRGAFVEYNTESVSRLHDTTILRLWLILPQYHHLHR